MVFSKDTFEKHQNLLLFCANKKWLRWLLGLNRLPENIKKKHFCQITPSSVHWIKSVNKKGVPMIGSACFTRQRFAEALAYNLSPFVYFQMGKKTVWHLSPVGILGMLAMVLVPKVGFLGFVGTVTDFFSGAGDGYAYRIANQTWPNLRAGTGTGHDNTAVTGNFGYMQCGSSLNVFAAIARSFLPFDTSALTSGATVSAATVNVYGSAKVSTIDHNLVIDKTAPASTTVLANTDYDSSHHSFVLQSDTQILCSAWNTAGYNAFPLNATGLSNINTTGVTEFGGKLDVDLSDTVPSWTGAAESYGQCHFSEETGTANDPYIEITYTVTIIPSFTKATLLLMGVG